MSSQMSRGAIPPEVRVGRLSPDGVAYLGREVTHGGQPEAMCYFDVGVGGQDVQPEVLTVPPRRPPRRRCPEVIAAPRNIAIPCYDLVTFSVRRCGLGADIVPLTLCVAAEEEVFHGAVAVRFGWEGEGGCDAG